jgi:1,2-diacylglycerol 3-alpha-glucosyltransferase
MNIVFLTNTYLPHVGGVARSVSSFAEHYRKLGHRVLIVAPEFQEMPENETDVIRVPAIQNFNASDFSVALPIPTGLMEQVRSFGADVIHSHHPFLLGSTAVRMARYLNLPLVFTHHTLYEQYTHYVPGDSPQLQKFIIELATRYANLCDQVFAPSESIRDLIMERGVTSPVDVVPTGVELKKFASGKGERFRDKHGIPGKAFVIGHMGRLAPEKNLDFLCQAVARVMKKNPKVWFLVVGTGSSTDKVRDYFRKARLDDRMKMAGVLQARDLADALAAMDIFAFASTSETQGMVLTEAMATGLPVVALDASGAREVVEDEVNGRLVMKHTLPAYTRALEDLVSMTPKKRQALVAGAGLTAKKFSMAMSAKKALAIYQRLSRENIAAQSGKEDTLDGIIALIKAEWDILTNVVKSGSEALTAATDGDKR